MMPQIRLWVLTAGMTVLIWIAADQRVTRSIEIKIPFSIKPAVPGEMVLQPANPDVKFIKIEFRGPTRAIAELKSVQESLTAELKIPERDPGRYDLNLIDELGSRMDQFPSGLLVVSTYPATMTIEVDRYVDKQVPLKVDMSTYQFEGPPQVSPDSVTVRVPAGAFEKLTADQRHITISMGGLLGEEEREGRPIQKTVAVPRELNGGLSASDVQPARVTVTATPLRRILKGPIQSVTIRVLPTTPKIFDRYRLVFSEQPESEFVTRTILVRGPVDVVTDLLDDPIKYAVTGVIHITREDIRDGRPAGPLSKEVQIINLPKGVELAEKPEVVSIELVPRS